MDDDRAKKPKNADDGAALPAVLDARPLARVSLSRETPWSAVASVFLNAHCDSENTRRAYALRLRRAEEVFAAFGVTTVAELDGAILAEYRRCVVDSAMSPSTQAQSLHALRSFLDWAAAIGAHDLRSETVRRTLRVPKAVVTTPRRILDEQQTRALLTAPRCTRDRAMLVTFLGAGLRVSEIAALDCGDLRTDGDGGWLIHVRQGKGRKDRLVPIHAEVQRAIVAYLEEARRQAGSEDSLFRCYDGVRRDGCTYSDEFPHGRMTRQSAFRIVRRLLTEAGIDATAYSPHSLRHSYAMRILRAGGNVLHVRKLLGHSSVTTTQVYCDHFELPELLAHVPPLPVGDAAPARKRTRRRA
jgi:site-specific recombinase XerD